MRGMDSQNKDDSGYNNEGIDSDHLNLKISSTKSTTASNIATPSGNWWEWWRSTRTPRYIARTTEGRIYPTSSPKIKHISPHGRKVTVSSTTATTGQATRLSTTSFILIIPILQFFCLFYL
ncbi:uncharacterized protein LOC120346693 [Styela clava]